MAALGGSDGSSGNPGGPGGYGARLGVDRQRRGRGRGTKVGPSGGDIYLVAGGGGGGGGGGGIVGYNGGDGGTAADPPGGARAARARAPDRAPARSRATAASAIAAAAPDDVHGRRGRRRRRRWSWRHQHRPVRRRGWQRRGVRGRWRWRRRGGRLVRPGVDQLRLAASSRLPLAATARCSSPGASPLRARPCRPPGPTTVGGSRTFTATVSPPFGTTTPTPTGNVNFYLGSGLLGSAALVNGTATLTTADLVGGTDTVRAAYQGDGVYAPSQAFTSFTMSMGTPQVAGRHHARSDQRHRRPVRDRRPAGRCGLRPHPSRPARCTSSTPPAAIASTRGPSRSTGTVRSTCRTSFSNEQHLYTFDAIYSGDGNYASATTSFSVHVLDKTTVSLSLGRNPAKVGQSDPAHRDRDDDSLGRDARPGTVTFLDGTTGPGHRHAVGRPGDPVDDARSQDEHFDHRPVRGRRRALRVHLGAEHAAGRPGRSPGRQRRPGRHREEGHDRDRGRHQLDRPAGRAAHLQLDADRRPARHDRRQQVRPHRGDPAEQGDDGDAPAHGHQRGRPVEHLGRDDHGQPEVGRVGGR